MFHRIIASLAPALLGLKAFLKKLGELAQRFADHAPSNQWEEALFTSVDLFTRVWTGGKTLRGVVAR